MTNSQSSQDIKNQALGLYEFGFNRCDVASILGIGKSTIGRWCVAAGIIRPKGCLGREHTEEEKIKIGKSNIGKHGWQNKDKTFSLEHRMKIGNANRKRRGPRAKNKLLLDIAISLYNNGMTCSEIEKETGVDNAIIWRWCKNLGIIRNRSQVQIGENNNGWKGGISLVDRRHTIEYRTWRTQVFQRDNFTCQECGKHGGHLNAHHIESFAKNEALRFDVSNGITLCVSCHKKEHWG
jgi:transposase-like protein